MSLPKIEAIALMVTLVLLGFQFCTHALAFDVENKLAAGDGATGDQFGGSVSISGSTAIVGAVWDDDAGNSSGAAYLFDVTTGTRRLKLTANDATENDLFGHSVAISGNKAIVGARTDGDGDVFLGSAYLFDTTTGDELFEFKASDGEHLDQFGISVGVNGNTVIVGASGDDDNGSSSGSAYLFDVTTGDQRFKLTASDAATNDAFGVSVAISGNTAVVGAPSNDDENGANTGSAYFFDVTTGEEVSRFIASDTTGGDFFGGSVAVSGSIAIVGAPLDNDSGLASGSAYLFDVATGNELFKLTASDAAAGDEFGHSVAIDGHRAIVGTYRSDDAGHSSGSAYVFDVRTGNELWKLTASDAAEFDHFGEI